MESTKILTPADRSSFFKKENVIEIDLKGRIGYEDSEYLEAELKELIDNDTQKVIIDCKELTHMCSKAISLLITSNNKIAENGGKLQMLNMKLEIKQLFKLMGLHLVFDLQ